MGEHTKIEWCDHSWNPWIGCTRVSPACDFCYAERFAYRFGGPAWGKDKPRRLTSPSNWLQPLSWQRAAERSGIRKRVFAASLADVFDAEVLDLWRDRLFGLIAATPNLDWLLLTKRPSVAVRYLAAMEIRVRQDPSAARIITDSAKLWDGADDTKISIALRRSAASAVHRKITWPMPNVWIGTTVENQTMATVRIRHLIEVPAILRFLSCEPLLGPLDLMPWLGTDRGIDWVITGGETGAQARPAHPDWFRSLRDQCVASGTPFFFKQWGNWTQAEERHGKGKRDSLQLIESGIAEHPPVLVRRIDKKVAGKELDGRTWLETPRAA